MNNREIAHQIEQLGNELDTLNTLCVTICPPPDDEVLIGLVKNITEQHDQTYLSFVYLQRLIEMARVSHRLGMFSDSRTTACEQMLSESGKLSVFNVADIPMDQGAFARRLLSSLATAEEFERLSAQVRYEIATAIDYVIHLGELQEGELVGNGYTGDFVEDEMLKVIVKWKGEKGPTQQQVADAMNQDLTTTHKTKLRGLVERGWITSSNARGYQPGPKLLSHISRTKSD